MQLRFWFDVVCPFAWIASTQVEALAAEAGVELVPQPVLLGGVLQATGAPTVPMDAMSPAKWRIIRDDAVRQAATRGVAIHWPVAHPQRSVDAMRLVAAAPPEKQMGVAADLFQAYWVRGERVTDAAVLGRVARSHGLPTDLHTRPEARAALFARTEDAVRAGVFGVPTLGVGDELFWGVDRLSAARVALGLPPEPRQDLGRRGGRVTFFHDFSSPFSYLASLQIEEVARAAGATIEWVPFLLGALFKQLGGPLVPISTFSDPKRAWVVRDLQRTAAALGAPLRWPSSFPLRTVLPLRVAIQEPATTACLYHAAWADNRDVGDPETVKAVLCEAGFDGAALVQGAAEAGPKATLRENTQRALSMGACGAPTFVVNDEHLFWGQDRLPLVQAALTGWRPPAASLP